ncbi:MAG: ATP-binding protein [Oligoflexia bacterium]|nr:ATP-binding protein [Oligoflexia bacterium]
MKKKKRSPLKKAIAPKVPASITAFSIVGVGASAGGLEAFTQLFKALPTDTGMAFVLIQHLDPSHSSFLAEALSKVTRMSVHEIKSGMTVQPNQIYVIPPNADVGILRGVLTILPRSTDQAKRHMPIDFFFRSLAADRGTQAIGVVLSGTATDGTDGLKAIQAEDGVTFVQDPSSAKFSGMPQSAVDARAVDFCLPVPKIAQELVRLARHPWIDSHDIEVSPGRNDDEDLQKICILLRSGVGVDFSEYKPTTIRRRLARRMALLKLKSLGDYEQYLRDNPGETKLLYEDVLIHVTSFFRDAEVFKRLKESVFPEIMKHKQAGAPIRMWVTGCSTGEEPYSIAISLLEYFGDRPPKFPIQIFGSDISERAIEKARAGLYPGSAVRDVSPEQLRRFFTKTESGYRISKQVRDICVFVRHDLARDPPFSKLDLVSCRNVLIYFDQILQRRVIATFHYCLNQPGFLVLGRTEAISGYPELFSVVDKSYKIFSRSAVTGTLRSLTLRGTSPTAPPSTRSAADQARPAVDVARHVDNLLLAQYSPPGVIVNDRMEILQIRGRTGPYLELPPGQPKLNLLKMVREGLLTELRMAIQQAKDEKMTIRREGIQVQQDGAAKICNVVVMPVVGLPESSESKEPLFVVLFEDARIGLTSAEYEKSAQTSRGLRESKIKSEEDQRCAKLEHELKATQEYLQSLTDEHQRTNDALTSVNEELTSSNEELQSLNEELETAKEELQSTNEELTTVNDEFQNRNQELSQVNGDLVNLLENVEIPILILDANRRIRRFTPRSQSVLKLLPSDVGRPIDDIKSNIIVENLDGLIQEVIETVRPKELEVQDREGHWLRMQIRPYKTVDNRIDGAVLSLVDVDVLKRAVISAEWARDYAAGIVEAVQTPLIALDKEIKVISANEAFYKVFGVSRQDTQGKSLYDLGLSQWNIQSLRTSLGEMLAEDTRFQNVEAERTFPRLGVRTMSLSARSVDSHTGMPMILLAIEDITDRKKAETERSELLSQAKNAQKDAEAANRTKDLFLATLSHELRTPLTALLMQAQLLRRGRLDPEKIRQISEGIELATKTQAQLIDDLLDVSRIVTGKLKMEIQPVDLALVVEAAIKTVSALAETKSIIIKSTLHQTTGMVPGDPIRLQQVVWNLLTNAIKFSTQGGTITITLKPVDEGAQIQVKDMGTGIDLKFLPQIFDRFTQAESTITRTHGGLGLGLAIVRYLVELHGGKVRAESPGKNKGSTFTVLLPLMKASKKKNGALKQKPALAPVLSAKRRSSRLKGSRILVVDDDPGTRHALTDLLDQAEVEVKAAASAEEAMTIYKEFLPEILISDIAMPGENGYSLIRRIRALESKYRPHVPALALTALASEEDQKQALSAGFQMHLAKPVDFDHLTDALLELRK